MSATTLYATIEKRLEVLQELSRRNATTFATGRADQLPSITISREFGCEGVAVAEKTQELLQQKTGDLWGLLDKKLLDQLANDHERTLDVLNKLGKKNPFLDEAMSTILTEWKSDKDYYQQLCGQIIPFAKGGHVIIVGVGGGMLTQRLPNCHHFRIVAPIEFKIESLARRHGISEGEAERTTSTARLNTTASSTMLTK